MPNVTYGRLDEVLRSLGFTLRAIEEENKVYLHERTGALVIFPEHSLEEEVLPHHLMHVRSTLDAYGIADPLDFATRLARAS
jgi:hypothetical protein